MKAAQFARFGGPDVIKLVDLPQPHPGPGEVRIAVRAAGVNASDWVKRRGEMDQRLPQTMGYEAAGAVDAVGPGVSGTGVGDDVFGLTTSGAAQAQFTVLSTWAPLPRSFDYAQAAAVPVAAETAARALDLLGVGPGSTLLVDGASGSVGSAAVQFAVHRGARVIGTGRPSAHDYLRSLGAHPVTYGPALADQVRAHAPGGVDAALDVAGRGSLPALIDLAGAPDAVVSIADPVDARAHKVRFSRGEDGRATYAVALAAQLADDGLFRIPVGRTFSLGDVAEAHRVGESRRVHGKLVLLVP